MAGAVGGARPSTVLALDINAPSYKWLVAAIVLVAGGTQTFAGNSVNLAIPRLMAAFGTDLATTQWVTTGFLITRTLMIPILGWLGAVMGTATCSWPSWWASSCRRSAAAWLPTSRCSCSSGCCRALHWGHGGPDRGHSGADLPGPPEGAGAGLRTVGWSAGHIISFTLGGYFVEHVSWRLIFFMGLPTGVLSVLLGWLMLPQQRDASREPVDYPGLMFLAGFLVPLLLAISLARDRNTAVSTILLLGGGAVSGGALFILWELLTRFPAVNLRLFRRQGLRSVCTTAFFNMIGLFGAQFMVPIFLQQVMGFTPFQAGLIIVPALIISGLSGVVSGRLNDLISPAVMAMAGFIVLTGVFTSFATVTTLTTAGVLVGYIILYRTCMFSTITSLTALNVQMLPPEDVRMGQGLMGLTRNIGASLGVTVASVFFERRRAAHQLVSYHEYDAMAPTHSRALDDVRHYLNQAGIMDGTADWGALKTIKQQMDLEAVAAGFRDSFLLIGVAFLIASLPMAWVVMRRLGSRSRSQTSPA